jgi:hypothetical protein
LKVNFLTIRVKKTTSQPPSKKPALNATVDPFELGTLAIEITNFSKKSEIWRLQII